MNFPLRLEFKMISLAPQLSVFDSNDQMLFYVKQKMFKLKESVTVFADETQTQPLYKIDADRVIDFSAQYHFQDIDGRALGSVKRVGKRSLLKAFFEVLDSNGVQILTIQKKSMFSIFHTFLVSRPDGELVWGVKRKPALFQYSYDVNKVASLSEKEMTTTLLSLLLALLLEKSQQQQ